MGETQTRGMFDQGRTAGELLEIEERLRGLADSLAGAKPEEIETQAAGLARLIEALELQQAARNESWPADAARTLLPGLTRILRQAAAIREMLGHGEDVHRGVAGILAWFYTAHSGSQYSVRGAPNLTPIPRLFTEA